MKSFDHLTQRARELEKADAARKAKQSAEAKQRWRPEKDSLPLRRARWVLSLYAAVLWALFIGCSMVNNAGFWARYVIFPYIALAIPVLLFTRGWIRMFFTPEGELPHADYRHTVAQCQGSLTAMAVLWAMEAALEIVFLLVSRPSPMTREWLFLGGCVLASLLTLLTRRYAAGLRYTLWDPDDPDLT